MNYNPLNFLFSVDDPDFRAGVASLSMILQVPPYKDHLEQLKAICLVVKNRLSNQAIEKAEKQKNVSLILHSSFKKKKRKMFY